jgi:hypothetical protein
MRFVLFLRATVATGCLFHYLGDQRLRVFQQLFFARLEVGTCEEIFAQGVERGEEAGEADVPLARLPGLRVAADAGNEGSVA